MLIPIVALCCICSALPAGAVDADHLIRPGVGIGWVHLGGILADAERAWGPPTERQPISGRNPTDDFTTYSWTHTKRSDVDGLTIYVLDRTGTIYTMSVTKNRWFSTAGGTVTSAGANWIGSTLTPVQREFGAPNPPHHHPLAGRRTGMRTLRTSTAGWPSAAAPAPVAKRRRRPPRADRLKS
jgi:hypothetical protein